MSAIIPSQPDQLIIISAPSQADVMERIKRRLSASSARVYGETYKVWWAWTQTNGYDVTELSEQRVYDFLMHQDTTHATRKRHLSALRKLADIFAPMSPVHTQLATDLKEIRAPAPEHITKERSRRALSPAESDALLRVWAGNSEPMARRNMAIVATLLLTGMRRAELAALQWRDLDTERGVIHIRHGKGDKRRDASILGDAAIDALTAWRTVQGSTYTHIFTAFFKGGKIGADKPMSTNSIQTVIDDTAQLAGLDKVKPHDLRRTLITEMLATGTPIQDAQAQAGHARGDTTLRYAQASSAEQRRQTTRLRFGAVKVK